MRSTLAMVVVLFFGTSLFAGDIDRTALLKAHNFLKATKQASFINGFTHFGTQFLSHKYVKTLGVNDGAGRAISGHFALVYDYRWSDGGETQLAFLCDTRGNVYKTQVLATNGIVQKPFAMANISIKILGETIYNALKKDLKESDRRLIRQLVDNADAQGLLNLALRIRQASQ